MLRFLFLLVLMGSSTSAISDSDLETVIEWMSGSFSSAEQAAGDADYYHITLEMARIWPGREDGYWLYVEQAIAATRDQPYRQRVYRVTRNAEGVIESAVFLLPEPAAAIGAWAEENALSDLSPEDLQLRMGCSVFLKRVDAGRFKGATRDRDCGSDLRGASYATSEVVLTPGRLESWDRGFDAEGKQVWGAIKGPYIFIREKE